jgi:hypothetical protein
LASCRNVASFILFSITQEYWIVISNNILFPWYTINLCLRNIWCCHSRNSLNRCIVWPSIYRFCLPLNFGIFS